MRYKYIDTFTPPQQITSITINNVTTSTIYDSSNFDSLVDSVGIGKIFIPTEQPVCEDGYYAKASYIDGDVITMVWEVVEVVKSENEETKLLKESINELHSRADTTDAVILDILMSSLPM